MRLPTHVVEAFSGGQEWAFDEVHSVFARPLLRFVAAQVEDEEHAQDIVQEVFLKAHRARAQYRPEFALSTWLWSIARNAVLDWRRSRRPEHVVDFSLDGMACARPTTESLLMERSREHSRRVTLGRRLSRLSKPQRKALLLRIVHQLSYAEIAARLGLSLSAVKSLLHRSKDVLAELGEGFAAMPAQA
jgi:RNA polymerase sigma-70 factor (ECF subfamily)